MSEVENFIIRQLESAHIDYSVRREFIHVACPFHEHSGRKQKLGFSRTSGGMHCFVCEKKGHWNEYARLRGLETFAVDDTRLQDFDALRAQFDRLTVERQIETPDWLEPWQGTWRGVSFETLASMPSYRWYDGASKGYRILWPVYMDGVFRGCTSARIDPNDRIVPKTRNLGGLDATRTLFGFDHRLVRSSRAVVLVEGQFDAIRLLDHAIPAVAIMGTGTWNPLKLQRLAARGIERIVLAMDGDGAGAAAAELIAEQAREQFDLRVVTFPAGVDPGDCGDAYLRVMSRLTKEYRDGDDTDATRGQHQGGGVLRTAVSIPR